MPFYLGLYLAACAFSCTLLIVAGIGLYRRRTSPRRIWKCVRYYGGGGMTSPRPMTEREVTRWIGRDCNAEVGHIDREMGFIFYRPRGI